MDSQRAHTDPEHHPYGARGLVVGPLTVYQETPVRFRSRTPNSTEQFTELGHVLDVAGQGDFASVAQPVERLVEGESVGGSTPSRGTKLKRKL